MTLVGKTAPNFSLQGYYKGDFGTYSLDNFKGKWVMLLFYPLDFTFVCPTEVLNFSREAEKYGAKNCEVLGISVDSQFVHKAWVETQHADGGLGGDLNYPLLADINKDVARSYGVLIEEAGVALRGLFLIDPDGTVQHCTINNLSVGRSVREANRVLDAFHFVTSHEGEVCPADWEEGDSAMEASPEGMRKYLSSSD